MITFLKNFIKYLLYSVLISLFFLKNIACAKYIRDKFDDKIEDTFKKIYSLSIRKNCSLRDACFIYSLNKLENNYKRKQII